MLLKKMMVTFLTLSVCLFSGWTSSAYADFPEMTLDTLIPGKSVSSLDPLKLKEQGEHKDLQGTVSWDGYELTAHVQRDKDTISTVLLQADTNNGLIGMFVTQMAEKNMFPVLLKSDDICVNLLRRGEEKGLNVEQSSEYAMEAMAKWADEGKKRLMLLFLPHNVMKGARAAYHTAQKSTLAEVLAPYGKELMYLLILSRDDDRCAFYMGALEHSGEYLKHWKE